MGNIRKGKVTIEVEVEYEWIPNSGDGIYEPIEGGYYDFDLPSDEELTRLINEAITFKNDTNF